MSATDTAGHFQSWVGQPSNLDRCDRCNAPRSVHGPDWTCPSPRSESVSMIPLVLGLNLVLAAIIARLVVGSAADQGQAMLMADAFMAGVVLSVVGVTGIGRRHR
jgi:hypothetical protein